jgi:hypothetical protein
MVRLLAVVYPNTQHPRETMLTPGDSRDGDTNSSGAGEEDWYQQLDSLVLEPPPYKLVPEQERVNKWP